MLALLIAIIASASVITGASSLGGGGGGSGGSSSVTPSKVYNTQYSSTDPNYYRTSEYNAQTGLEDIHAAEAYASLASQGLSVAGDGVKIAIVDSGVQSDHIEISANLDSTNSHNYVSSDGDDDISDGSGHGTHVASTAAGVRDGSGMHGVAYNADIIVARVLDDTGHGSSFDIFDGIKAVSDADAKVINLSLGGASDSLGILLDSLTYAKSKDVVMAIATGNESSSNPAYPAVYANNVSIAGFAIAVGSVDASNSISDFSNKCGTAKDYCLVAPGESIYAATPTNSDIYKNSGYPCSGGYCSINGTSMATPHVAGAAAVIRGAWPSMTANQVVSLLLTTADDLGDAGVDDIYGHGMLNLYKAVKPVGTTTLSSSSKDSAGYNISSTSITVDPIFGDAFSTNVATALKDAVFFDSFGRDFKANLDTKISKVSSYSVPTLDNIAFNNYNTQTIPFSFGSDSSSKLKFQVKSYNDTSESGNGLNRGYSQNRYGLKFLISDKSQEDKYLTNSNGFSFTESFSNKFKAGFAFNSNEAANSEGNKANEFGFISTNNFASNPYQSFVTSSNSINTQNSLTQRNYNQIFASQKFMNNKFSTNFLYQTAYETSSFASQIGNRQNQISDLGFTYLPGHESNLSVSFGNLNEFNNNFLNSKSFGAFSTAGDVKTSYFKISSTKKIADNLYLISAFSEGSTKANGNDLGIFRNYSGIKSRSSSVALVNDNIFGGKLGIVYSEPLRVYSGKATVNTAVGLDSSGNAIRYSTDVSLKSQGKEQDIELFYSKELNKGGQVKFNFIAQKEPGNVKNAANNYLGFVTYGKKF